MAGVGGVPSTATAVALNVTVTDTTAASYLSVYPAGGSQPTVSNLNWTRGETVPNLVIVPVGTGGQTTFYNDAGSADVIKGRRSGYHGLTSTAEGVPQCLVPCCGNKRLGHHFRTGGP